MKKVEFDRTKHPCFKQCEFNAVRDFGPVEAPMVISFEEMLVTGVVPPAVESSGFNDVGDNPDVIVGRVSNVFQALRVRGAIMSAAQGFATELRSRGAAPGSTPAESTPAAGAAAAADSPGFTSSSTN